MIDTAAARLALEELYRPGQTGVPGRWLWWLGRLTISAVVVVTNLVGALAVILIIMEVLPLPAVPHAGSLRALDLEVAGAYVAVAVVVGLVVGTRTLWPLRRWLVHDQEPSAAQQRQVLGAPLRLFFVQMALWVTGAAVFAAIDVGHSAVWAARLAVAILLTGLSTAACAYLLVERILRPAAARALGRSLPDGLVMPGVASRAVLAWSLGTGVPLAGLVAVGALQLIGGDLTAPVLGRAATVLGGVALTVGLFSVVLVARAIADPVDEVRAALARVESGHFDVRLPVYDGSQLGRLQLGFNKMAAGLAERERIRHAMGVYLDPDVAARIVDEGVHLEGEEVEVTVLFVDVRGFTAFAEDRTGREVVATLNRLFDRIVPIIHDRDGVVNKFVGDGLMAVFGAPRRLPDHADRALGAALAIQEAVAGQELQVGVGLNSGPVVAGNVGGGGRFEFSVIGDVVNTAARVEAATRATGDTILLTEDTKRLIRNSGVDFVGRQEMTFKGKTAPVAVYTPGPGADDAGRAI